MSTATMAPSRSVKCFGNVDVPIRERLRVLDDGDEHHPTIGEMLFSVLTPKDGDKRLVWNRFSLPEIEDARKMFDDLVAQGMLPHRVSTDGEPAAEVLKNFDAMLEEVSFLDEVEERRKFPGSALSRRVGKASEVVFLPRRQMVGG